MNEDDMTYKIDENGLRPGEKLDELIENTVMGPKPNGCICGHFEWCRACSSLHYSTDISAAWEALDKIKTRERSVSIHAPMGETHWVCKIYRNGELESVGIGYSAPHAICLAALNTVGHDC